MTDDAGIRTSLVYIHPSQTFKSVTPLPIGLFGQKGRGSLCDETHVLSVFVVVHTRELIHVFTLNETVIRNEISSVCELSMTL